MEEKAKEGKPNNPIINMGKDSKGLGIVQQLPQDILFDIFSRLPLKPLIKFKTVCKLWFNIISDPNFIEFHLQQWTSKFLTILVFSQDDFNFYSFNFKEMSIKPKINEACLQNDQFWFGKWYRINEQASCDGLILFDAMPYEFDHKLIFHIHLCLYNSTTQSLKFLPSMPDLDPVNCYYSLVHDDLIQKYKVMVWFYPDREFLQKCCILTLDERIDESINGANSPAIWRMSIPPFPERLEEGFSKPVTVNGEVHWIAQTIEEEEEVFIQSFDIAREVFEKRIEPPCQPIRYDWENPMNFTLLAIKGSLCLMSLVSEREDELNIWVLKSGTNCWILQHKITLSSMLSKPVSFKSLVKSAFNPVFVMESCSSRLTYIFVRHYYGLFCFNLETREIRQISIENQDSCFGLDEEILLSINPGLPKKLRSIRKNAENMLQNSRLLPPLPPLSFQSPYFVSPFY